MKVAELNKSLLDLNLNQETILNTFTDLANIDDNFNIVSIKKIKNGLIHKLYAVCLVTDTWYIYMFEGNQYKTACTLVYDTSDCKELIDFMLNYDFNGYE